MIKVKLKMPKGLLDAAEMRTKVKAASDDARKFAKGKLEGVTGKFDTVKVAWQETESGVADWTFGTDSKVYGYLDEGTKVRYAHMTSDFAPRTSPESFSVGPKVGGVAFINKNRPLPGIKARKWTEQTAKETEAMAKKRFAEILK